MTAENKKIAAPAKKSGSSKKQRISSQVSRSYQLADEICFRRAVQDCVERAQK